MRTRSVGSVRAGAVVVLLIVAAAVALFLLPTPHAAKMADTASARPAVHAGCIAVPRGFSEPAVVAAVPPAGIWKGWRYGRIALAATPGSTLMDAAVGIRVSGLEPGEPITLRASTADYRKHEWTAQATFIADRNGIVDAGRDAPKYGSYAGVHAMGLVWSMLPVGAKDPDATFYAPPAASFPILLQALADGRTLAEVTLTRSLVAPGVQHVAVDSDGLVGELYTPASPGPHPAVIVLGGSEGGLYPQVNEAALLASHGYVALGLAYFQGFEAGDRRLAALPKMLMDIPLEYFTRAAGWLRRQPGVDPRHVAIMGWSKGAEAALLTAATFPGAFQAVIAFMPTMEVWAGIQYSPGPVSSSWTLDGKPLPWVTPVITGAMFATGKPVAFLDGYRNGLRDKAAAKAAVIRVERIAGPVLLVSAGDDAIWPSSSAAARIMRRLHAHHHPVADESVCYATAGHAILPPWRPTNATAAGGGGISIAFGGNPVAYAFADRDAWSRVLAFLQTSLVGGRIAAGSAGQPLDTARAHAGK